MVKIFASQFAVLGVSLLLRALSVDGNVFNTSKPTIQPNPENGHWIDTWASMPQLTEPANLPPVPFVCSTPIPSNIQANLP
jgi:hypothetical protein